MIKVNNKNTRTTFGSIEKNRKVITHRKEETIMKRL